MIEEEKKKEEEDKRPYLDIGEQIERKNKRIREYKEHLRQERMRKKKKKVGMIKLSPVRLKAENTDRYRRGARVSVHSKIFRKLDENEKKKSRERRSIELKNEKIRAEKEKKKINTKGREKRVPMESELLNEYKGLILEGLIIINDLMIRVGNDYRNERVDFHLIKVEKVLK